MTGGRVVVLGRTGKNFAAGMSGGIAYVYDEDKKFRERCNTDMVELGPIHPEDKDSIYYLLYNHCKYSKSKKAKMILENMPEELKKFVRVMPIEYKGILAKAKVEEKLEVSEALDG